MKLRQRIIKIIGMPVVIISSMLLGAHITKQNLTDTLAQPEVITIHHYHSDYASLRALNNQGDAYSYSNYTLTELFFKANPRVVAISTATEGRNAFGRIVRFPSSGSGFFISPNGHIATNFHVIDGVTSVSVILYDGTTHDAIVIGHDPITDLAVIRVDKENTPYLRFADADTIMVGQQIAAIGNPLGEFLNSMTIGYISALEREINIDGIPRIMLQTDAAVNPGNSGGPLINTAGQVVGVVTAKSSGANIEGIAFAIPANEAYTTTASLVTYGYVASRATLGVVVGPYHNGRSIRVQYVRVGSAAYNAGVIEGDVIVALAGQTVTNHSGLRAILFELAPNSVVEIRVIRDSQELIFDVTLGYNMPLES